MHDINLPRYSCIEDYLLDSKEHTRKRKIPKYKKGKLNKDYVEAPYGVYMRFMKDIFKVEKPTI